MKKLNRAGTGDHLAQPAGLHDNRLQRSRGRKTPVTAAEFERIHPFRDGNGRTGRLAMNLVLVRSGYPPALIAARQRREYLAALDRSDRGDVGPLVQLVARSIRDGIERVLLPALAGDHRLIPLAALERPDLSVRAMIAAARRDRLRAVREGGRWYATRGAVDEYLASRR